MTIYQFIFIVIAIAIMIGGAFVIYKSLKDNKTTVSEDKDNTHPTQTDDEDSTEQTFEKPTLPQSLKQREQPLPPPMSNDFTNNNNFANFNTTSPSQNTAEPLHSSATAAPQTDVDDTAHESLTTKQPAYPEDKDAFSLLANATESITPNMQIFDENQLRKSNYKENSSILDSHIQAQVEQEQNSPLNNAVHTISLTIKPNQTYSRISGQQLLTIIDKYGLKYGAMNMFHRYEHINGTGLLWFSMMMTTDDGVFPFDLNSLPNQFMSGLAVFLSLPHPKAKQGFDSMVSLARLFAKELNASVYDDKDQLLTKESVEAMQEIAINFGK